MKPYAEVELKLHALSLASFMQWKEYFVPIG
jgi:hypothetical protein